MFLSKTLAGIVALFTQHFIKVPFFSAPFGAKERKPNKMRGSKPYSRPGVNSRWGVELSSKESKK